MRVHHGVPLTVLAILMMVSSSLAYAGSDSDYGDRDGMSDYDKDGEYGDRDDMDHDGKYDHDKDYDYGDRDSKDHDGMSDYDKDGEYGDHDGKDHNGKYGYDKDGEYGDRDDMDHDGKYGHDKDYDYGDRDGKYGHDKHQKYDWHPVPDASGKYPPPAHQLKFGVPIHNVQCNDPLALYIRGPPSPDTLMMMADQITEIMTDVSITTYDRNSMMHEMVNDPMVDETVGKLMSGVAVCIKDSTAMTMMTRGIDLVSFDVLEPAVLALMDAMELASFVDTMDYVLRDTIREAINTYDMNDGSLDVLSKSSTDELYVFVLDSDYMVVAHGANPDNVGNLTLYDVDPTPSVDEIDMTLTEKGEAWTSYTFANPATGEDEDKKTLLILYDGYIFGTGYYASDHTGGMKHMYGMNSPCHYAGNMKSYDKNIDKTLRDTIRDAINTYDMNDGSLDVLTKSSTDELYVFVLDSDYMVVAHGANPDNVGTITFYDVDPTPSVDELDMILAKKGEAWASYTFANPATGEDEYKKTLLILYDGYIFGAGYYMSDHTGEMKHMSEMNSSCHHMSDHTGNAKP